MQYTSVYQFEQLTSADINSGFQNALSNINAYIQQGVYTSSNVVFLSGLSIQVSSTDSSAVICTVGQGWQNGQSISVSTNQTLNILSGSPGTNAWGTGLAADSTNPRIDLCIVQYQSAGINPAQRLFENTSTGSAYTQTVNTSTGDYYAFDVLHGTPAASPVAPSAPAGWIALATVEVPANATSIIATDITDETSPYRISGGALGNMTGQAFYRDDSALNDSPIFKFLSGSQLVLGTGYLLDNTGAGTLDIYGSSNGLRLMSTASFAGSVSLAAGTVFTNNGSYAGSPIVTSITVDSGLTVTNPTTPGSAALGVNYGNANIWTASQAFNAGATLPSGQTLQIGVGSNTSQQNAIWIGTSANGNLVINTNASVSANGIPAALFGLYANGAQRIAIDAAGHLGLIDQIVSSNGATFADTVWIQNTATGLTPGSSAGTYLGLGDNSALLVKASGFIPAITDSLALWGNQLILQGASGGASPSYGGWTALNATGANVLQLAPAGSVTTQHNTLDDGTGKPTFAGLATFSAAITGTGSTGSLTAGTGILGNTSPWTASQTIQGNVTATGYVQAQGTFPNLGDGGGVIAGFYFGDVTQPILWENNNLLMLGKYNVSGSTQGVIPNNTVWSFLQINSSGQVGTGSWNNTAGTGSVFRNVMDDGSGNASVAGTFTASGATTVANTLAVTDMATFNSGSTIPAGQTAIFGSTTDGMAMSWDSTLGGLVYTALS